MSKKPNILDGALPSLNFSKTIADIKAGKIPDKEPPKYIFERHPRNNKKIKKLNPRWKAWSKRQKDKKIDKDVENYVKKRKGDKPINKDLTKDNSKKNKNSDQLKAGEKGNGNKTKNKTENKTENKTNNGGPNLDAANKILSGNKKEVTMKDFQSDTKTEKTENKKKKESKYIRNPKTKTLVRRTSQKGKQLLKIKARRDALIKKRFGKKKKNS